MRYAIIDIETTGGNYKTGKITEIAVFIHNGHKVVNEYSSLVNPGIPVPPFISRLTGINDKMLASAPSFEEIADEVDKLTANCIFVAHNAHFDYGFIREEFRRVGIDYKRRKLCTVQLSRHAFPGLASYSLDRITSELSIELNGHHRASSDAEATTRLFERIIAHHQNERGLFDAHFGMPTLDGLNSSYINDTFLRSIPDEAGVARFYDAADQLIYSKRSANVLSSICEKLKQIQTKNDAEFRKSLHRIDYQLTGSQLLAQLLEAHDVLSHKPHFNHKKFSTKAFCAADIHVEDGRSYLYLTKRGRCEDPLVVYSNFHEGKAHLEDLAEQWGQNLCELKLGRNSVAALMLPEGQNWEEGLSPSAGNFVVVDEGRYASERCHIFVESGAVVGYGYYDQDFQFSPDPLEDVQVRFKPFAELELVLRKMMEKKRFESRIEFQRHLQ